METLRSRVWETLRSAGKGVTVAALAASLGTTPERVLGAMLPEMTETPEGFDAPAVYLAPGPTLVPRRFPS